MTITADDFVAFHTAVHGESQRPFEWQHRLLGQVAREHAWPRVLDLPTGAGKTTCLDIALFALAIDAQTPHARWCPRRIAMVVDRRIVVDQVAERGRKLLRALVDPTASPVVREVARLLRTLSSEADAFPVGVFTLRGGMPKDDGWARTPDQPLILASTVDQIGSRLLVQGYGVSRGMAPVHAGLIGNDLLLLLDEVHLSRPFMETLEALDELRKQIGGAPGLATRFHHAFLSGTPGHSSGTVFRLTEGEKRRDSPLGPRLHTPKPARLLDVDDRTTLELACINEAAKLTAAHRVIGVVVNRVASASAIAQRLREKLGEAADVALLTGRMRPLDRDDVLRVLRPRIATGRDRASAGRCLIVVGTQCLEAGADFDFDALVTEAASIDALRQRFGRVDRLGIYEKSASVIVRDRSAKDDPVYGDALVKTVAWLGANRSKKTKEIDFGVLALAERLPLGSELDAMLAPKERAPVLLPSYLDLWMQTSPRPAVVPDVSLWLHGPRSGPADVQIIWRADLNDGDLEQAIRSNDHSRPMEAVAAIRPSTLEAVSLPFALALRWLGGADVGRLGDLPDVEGTAHAEARGESEAPSRGLSLRWDGDDSAVVPARELRPGDTVIVPATRGGLREGCFDPGAREAVADLAERAAFFGRRRPILRLNPAVLSGLGFSIPTGDEGDARAALAGLADVEPSRWRSAWLQALAKGRKAFVVDADADDAWMVLEGKPITFDRLRAIVGTDDRETIENGIELTTDEDDSFHAGRPVSLARHSADVETFAREYGRSAGLPHMLVDDLALAGWLHDIGKADRRFQVLLRGGSEIELYKDETPWAKSGMPPGAKAAHRLAQARSGYPRGARHEVQSLAMLERHIAVVRAKSHDIDLVLHLVASHHGRCRPFAPPAPDDAPVDVVLPDHRSATLGSIDFGPTSSKHDLHRLDSPVAARFWGLVEKYGWLELCWLEAILRLADHRASEQEQEQEAADEA